MLPIKYICSKKSVDSLFKLIYIFVICFYKIFDCTTFRTFFRIRGHGRTKHGYSKRRAIKNQNYKICEKKKCLFIMCLARVNVRNHYYKIVFIKIYFMLSCYKLNITTQLKIVCWKNYCLQFCSI